MARMKDLANKQAAPVDTIGAESLASVYLVKGGGRFGKEFHMGRDPKVEVKCDEGVTTAANHVLRPADRGDRQPRDVGPRRQTAREPAMRHHRQLCSACGVRKDPCPRLARGEPCPYTPASYAPALEQAQMMMEATELEPTSALKQAGSDNGIPYGPEMETFVKWARKQWGI